MILKVCVLGCLNVHILLCSHDHILVFSYDALTTMLKCRGDWEIRDMCTLVLKCSNAHMHVCSHDHIFVCSHAQMLALKLRVTPSLNLFFDHICTHLIDDISISLAIEMFMQLDAWAITCFYDHAQILR